MAIDTRVKRAATFCHPCYGTQPVPDSSVNAADRAHVSWVYRGITISAGGGGGADTRRAFARRLWRDRLRRR